MSTAGPKTGVSVHTTQPSLFVLVQGAMSRFLGKQLFITFCCFCKTVLKSSHSGSFVLIEPQKHIRWRLKNTFNRQQESAGSDSERIFYLRRHLQKRVRENVYWLTRANCRRSEKYGGNRWSISFRKVLELFLEIPCECVSARTCACHNEKKVCVCVYVCRQSTMEFGMGDIHNLSLAENDLKLSLIESDYWNWQKN